MQSKKGFLLCCFVSFLTSSKPLPEKSQKRTNESLTEKYLLEQSLCEAKRGGSGQHHLIRRQEITHHAESDCLEAEVKSVCVCHVFPLKTREHIVLTSSEGGKDWARLGENRRQVEQPLRAVSYGRCLRNS